MNDSLATLYRQMAFAWLTAATVLSSAVCCVATVDGAAREIPPLSRTHANRVLVDDVVNLTRTIENAADDTCILIADGTYRLERLIHLRDKKNLTIRSASADPTKVTLCGRGWESGDRGDDILRIGHCENITVAHLSFADCRGYAVKVEAENHPRDIGIYHCHFRNIGTRAVKGSGGRGRAAGGYIRYCHFENTKIPPADWLFGGNYISGIDMMALDGWVISDNVFRNIKGRSGSARAAIFVWVLSQNVTVERNLIVDCDRGIAFGNPSGSTSQVAADEFHVQNGVCRNNFIVPGPDAGIELWWVDGVKVYNNTIWRHRSEGRGIRFGSRSREVHIANNLIRGALMHEGQGGRGAIRLENNITGDLDNYFASPSAGDLRITAQATSAIDAAIPLPEVIDDFDRRPRGSHPDIGAAER